ncbi:hypothetical protein UlMin_005136 [Ulmus minor]
MEKYFKRKLESPFLEEKESKEDDGDKSRDMVRTETKFSDLPMDPGLRCPILDYNPNDRDQIRREFLLRGPCQPRSHKFPMSKCGQVLRKFNHVWFEDYPNWLEYSIAKDAAFCLCCYLFKPIIGKQVGSDSFRFQTHVGGPSSMHNQAWRNCEALMKEKQHIETIIFKQSKQAKKEYRIHLKASVDCVRFLLQQGLAFRRHDESNNSLNQGNFLEFLQFASSLNDDIRDVTLNNAPENMKFTSPDIQKDIVNAVAVETHMDVVLLYVNNKDQVIECFIGIEHVPSTTALSLKFAIDKLFSRYSLSISRLRGQGYDGASNMQGEFNGLKAVILKENSSVAKKHTQIELFFSSISIVVNVVGASAKRSDILQDKQGIIIAEALQNGEISSGRGLNQHTSLKRCGDTHWGSHYGTLINLIIMFSSTIEVLEVIVDDGSKSEQKYEASHLLEFMQSLDFIFSLHLMRNILGFTNELSVALQRKDQDIINAMSLVKLFYSVIDMQLRELNDRFNEVNTELLICMVCLSPIDFFSSFDKKRLIQLAEYYQDDFSTAELMALDIQLETYIIDMRSSEEFRELKGINDLAQTMVASRKILVYPLVYRLLTLALILPVATATVERVFSAMSIVKNRLCNRIGDQWMNDSLIVYIEKEIASYIDNELIMHRFQNMKTRRGQI